MDHSSRWWMASPRPQGQLRPMPRPSVQPGTHHPCCHQPTALGCAHPSIVRHRVHGRPHAVRACTAFNHRRDPQRLDEHGQDLGPPCSPPPCSTSHPEHVCAVEVCRARRASSWYSACGLSIPCLSAATVLPSQHFELHLSDPFALGSSLP